MFYERYVELCRKKNVSPSFAAEKAGFNKGTVTSWKRKYALGEDVDPNQDIINKICDYFGCTEQAIRGINENSPSTKTGNDTIDSLIEILCSVDNADLLNIKEYAEYVLSKHKK